MGTELVTKWNFTGGWNDERIERWLERMATEGLHLVSAKPFGRYVFRRGAPLRISYRLDVAAGPRVDVDYLQLLTDAGWRMAAQRANTYFWCNERADAAELFTDAPSRALKYERLAKTTALILVALALALSKPVTNLITGEPLSGLDKVTAPVCLAVAVYSAYAFARLRARIRALRDPAQ
ncbi:DUF2812 domain-containing protein [Massilia sp. METH4]|uniref:DUF2812 domain-containing protein n=1 Tax=Massilia sp. METH4 TaxID=3123041 RepID=UPI0030D27136